MRHQAFPARALHQLRAALAWLLPSVLLSLYLIWTDRLVIPANPPADGARVMQPAAAAPPHSTRGGAAKPPGRSFENKQLQLDVAGGGRTVLTSERQLRKQLADRPGAPGPCYHLAQVHARRGDVEAAVKMLRLAAKDPRFRAAQLHQQALLADRALAGIKYDPQFLTFLRQLPEQAPPGAPGDRGVGGEGSSTEVR